MRRKCYGCEAAEVGGFDGCRGDVMRSRAAVRHVEGHLDLAVVGGSCVRVSVYRCSTMLIRERRAMSLKGRSQQSSPVDRGVQLGYLFNMCIIPRRMLAIEMFGDKNLGGKVPFERHICGTRCRSINNNFWYVTAQCTRQ